MASIHAIQSQYMVVQGGQYHNPVAVVHALSQPAHCTAVCAVVCALRAFLERAMTIFTCRKLVNLYFNKLVH